MAKMASRRRFGAFVYTVASRGSRERTVGTQECTQIGENGLSAPFWGICVHCCVAGVARADGGGRRSVHRSEKMGSRRRSGAFVYTVTTRGSRERSWGAQECTQIGENGLSAQFWGICVHCCDAGVARADGGDAGVYTDRRKWALGAVSGHLCTLLRRPVASGGASGAVARSASSPRRQPTQTLKDLKVINASLWEKKDDR